MQPQWAPDEELANKDNGHKYKQYLFNTVFIYFSTIIERISPITLTTTFTFRATNQASPSSVVIFCMSLTETIHTGGKHIAMVNGLKPQPVSTVWLVKTVILINTYYTYSPLNSVSNNTVSICTQKSTTNRQPKWATLLDSLIEQPYFIERT